jgi:hypothetical protein
MILFWIAALEMASLSPAGEGGAAGDDRREAPVLLSTAAFRSPDEEVLGRVPASSGGEAGEPGFWGPFPAVSRDFPSSERGAPEGWLVVETGTYFKELSFQAVAAKDGLPRTISGFGLVPVEVEGSVRLGKEWSAGVGAFGAFSDEVELWGVGPQVTWRFFASHQVAPSRPPETEHFLKAGVFYEEFNVTERGFGSFKPTLAPQIGYQFRTPIGGEGGWSFQLDIRYEYAPFRYREPVLSGDRSISASSLFLGLGVAIAF